MICPNCKREITVPGRFCGYCGEPLESNPVEDDDEMKTMMADDDDIVTEEFDSNGMDGMAGPEEETYSTEYAGDSDKNITLVRTDEPEIPDISTQSSDPDQTEELDYARKMREEQGKSRRNTANENSDRRSRDSNARQQNAEPTRKQKQRQKGDAASMWIRILSVAAVLLVVVCAVLAFRFFLGEKDGNWIAQLSDLDYVETQKAGSNTASKTYILDSEFERMSVKATIKQPAVAASSSEEEEKLLQIWIDDSLVYEIEAGQSEKEDWTFAIDLRGVDRMTIFTAEETTLDDVQVIRQSAEKETESQNAKSSNSKNSNSKNSSSKK